QFDGSYLTFPGMNPAIELREHQRNAIARGVREGRGLFGHEVGTGKTFLEVAVAIESKRLGLANKPAIACLKANIAQFTRDAQLLYPNARILSLADVSDAAQRKEMVSRITTGDYDLIILT